MASTIFQALTPGKTWRVGPRAPSDSVGINGDFWLNDSNGDCYEKIAGTYVLVPLPAIPGVSSFNGRTGAVVPTSGDYTATLVGLGNVTNDAQLKRSAGDFATFTTKSTPTTSDVLLIEDAAASGAKKSITIGSLPASTATTSSPYITTPVSPNAFDDEFNSGSNDLATRGYTVINASTGATLTRSGDISPWDATGPAGNTYWSTLIGSWIFIQGAPGVQIDVIKTITLTAGDVYYARMAGSYNVATAANGRYNEIGFYGWTGTILDNNNRVLNTVRDDTSATAYQIFDMARFTGGVLGGTGAGRYALGGHDIRGVRFDSGTTHYTFSLDSNNGELRTGVQTGTPSTATLVRFAVRNLFSSSGSAVPQIWGIDFIRKKVAADKWLIP